MGDTILEAILKTKRDEITLRKELKPVRSLEQSVHYNAPTVSLRRYLDRTDLQGVIAEIKRRSPSKGEMQPYLSVEELSIGYMQAGASALSILTDEKYFGGNLEDLRIARKFNFCPILRKDFIIDEYQIVEARSYGADVILLIAAALTPAQVITLATFAHTLGLEVLLELHSADEASTYDISCADLIGVNSRDLRTFELNTDLFHQLKVSLPNDKHLIAESGIRSGEEIKRLKSIGYKGFLIGETFLKENRPEHACRDLIRSIK